MDVGGGLLRGEARRGVGRLLEDPEAATHGAPDDGVMVEFGSDVPCLRDLPLMSHANGDEVRGYVGPKALGAFVRRVGVWGRLPWNRGTSYTPLHFFMRFDNRWWTSPPPVLPPPSSSSNLCRWGDFLPLFSVDR